ncbi:MAG: glutamate--tRNA ligase, partial [Planctomycetota bacterium]
LASLPLSAVTAEIEALGVPADMAERFWAVVQENISTRADMADWWRLFSNGADPVVAEEDRDFVTQAFAMLPDAPYDQGTWASWTAAVKEATGRKGKQLFMPLRLAVTGRPRGPEMADILPLLQKRPAL